MAQLVKNPACNGEDLGLIPGLGRSPGGGKGWLPTPVFWPGKFLRLSSPWSCKELDMTDFHFHLLSNQATLCLGWSMLSSPSK